MGGGAGRVMLSSGLSKLVLGLRGVVELLESRLDGFWPILLS